MNYLAIPIGYLQFWLFWALSLVFFAFLARALFRRQPERGGRRAGRSRVGIVLQSVGIGSAGFGPVRPTLSLADPAALAGAFGVLLLMGGAIYLFAASSAALGKNWSFEARTRSDHELIRSGPYARVRHPIYLGMFLFMLGLAAALGHWPQLIVGVPLFLGGTGVRTRLEDRLLQDQFGKEFEDYARSTPALIPRL